MAHIGQDLTYSVVFTNPSSGIATDPTSVRFLLREEVDGTELEWIYNAVPVAGTHYPVGANPIIKDSTGNFHVVWVSRKPERHTGFWAGAGTVNQSSQTTAFVRHSEVRAIDGV